MAVKPPLLFTFRGPWRRIVYVAVYEGLAIILVAVALTAGDYGTTAAGITAVGSSTIAMAWNWVYNTLFERWETRQSVRGRGPLRRAIHGIGFEGGLAIWLVPFMAWTLDVSVWQALGLEVGLLLFFLAYTVVFTWVFDRLFGLPASAL
ncbi:MAG: PACE efflux transporter [Burkholderiaceae bacterium]|nr:MAG: PACE efflux transporter [Burkholderiaceae bacterium]